MLTVATLRELVTTAKARRPELAGRLDRAAMIVLLRTIEPQPDGSWKVESEREPGRFYTLSTEHGCACPDFERAPGGRCKHDLAVGLWLACRQKDRERQRADDRTALALAQAGRAQLQRTAA